MNLLILLDLTDNPCKNFKFYSLQGQNVNICLIFTNNQRKFFLVLPITRGGTCIPGLHWELPPPSFQPLSWLIKINFSFSLPRVFPASPVKSIH